MSEPAPQTIEERIANVEEFLSSQERERLAVLSVMEEHKAAILTLLHIVRQLAIEYGIPQATFESHFKELRARFLGESLEELEKTISPSFAAWVDLRTQDQIDVGDPIELLFPPKKPNN